MCMGSIIGMRLVVYKGSRVKTLAGWHDCKIPQEQAAAADVDNEKDRSMTCGSAVGKNGNMCTISISGHL